MIRPEPASLLLRLLAMLYDLMVLIALWMVTAAIALAVTRGALDAAHPVYRLVLLAVAAGYLVISWRYSGQTIGMRAWRLRLTGRDGGLPTWSSASLRFAVSIVSLLAGGLGFVWCLIDARKRAWHDIAAGTELVRIAKPCV